MFVRLFRPATALLLTFSLASLPRLRAQQPGTLDTITNADREAGPTGVIPEARGFNLSLATTSQHDSAGGWSNILSPTVAYRFDQHFSLNATVSTFPYINVVTTTKKKNVLGVVTKSSSALATKNFLLGDTSINGSVDAHTHWLDYNLTATLGLPTGDDASGLGAGQVTYAVIHHFEHPFGDYFTPDDELGIDDDPNLLTPRVRKSYTVVGTSAHLQAGVGVDLPWNLNFETDAYEELPLSNATITTTTGKGKLGKQLTSTTQGSGEDNGFTNELDIPLNPHMTLTGFYNRSLRNHEDTAGFTLTFLLRGAPKAVTAK